MSLSLAVVLRSVSMSRDALSLNQGHGPLVHAEDGATSAPSPAQISSISSTSVVIYSLAHHRDEEVRALGWRRTAAVTIRRRRQPPWRRGLALAH